VNLRCRCAIALRDIDEQRSNQSPRAVRTVSKPLDHVAGYRCSSPNSTYFDLL